MTGNGMTGPHVGKMEKYEWLTPTSIIDDLGPFDLDPCASVQRPWDTAKNHYTIQDNGLIRDWKGFVWCNPPYGKYTGEWLNKLAMHGNGIALIFARTETHVFYNYVWSRATAALFIKGRLTFFNVDGTPGDFNAGAPSVLVAYGKLGASRLMSSTIPGKFILI